MADMFQKQRAVYDAQWATETDVGRLLAGWFGGGKPLRLENRERVGVTPIYAPGQRETAAAAARRLQVIAPNVYQQRLNEMRTADRKSFNRSLMTIAAIAAPAVIGVAGAAGASSGSGTAATGTAAGTAGATYGAGTGYASSVGAGTAAGTAGTAAGTAGAIKIGTLADAATVAGGAMGLLGGGSATPTAPPTVAAEPEPVMPTIDSAAIAQRRRRSLQAQLARRGRESTILTDPLGG